jgi:hypothetical protein
MKWHINDKLVNVQPMKLSTAGLRSMKSVQDGSQDNSQNCTKKRLGICKQLVDVCGADGDHCLEIIITGDETWIHRYEPDRKHPHSPTKKTHPTTGILTLSVFWDSQRLLLEHYQERGSTVNSAYYSEMQCDEIKPVI